MTLILRSVSQTVVRKGINSQKEYSVFPSVMQICDNTHFVSELKLFAPMLPKFALLQAKVF